MSVSWVYEEGVQLLVVRISGELALKDMGNLQEEAATVLQGAGRSGFLVILEAFEGWSKGDDWADTSFPDDNDQYLSRFAIVGEEQWRDKALMFSLAGLRPVEIEYFTDETAAREWLAAA
ncbi:MAG: STAS/SEC14 domain-containing protein [Gammaproteobacteria bacterium]